MKLKECIEYVDRLKPNAFSNDQKTHWINEIEGRFQTDVLLFDPVTNITQYTWADNQDTVLLIREPFTTVYTSYLEAKIDYQNGEYDKAANSFAQFEEQWGDFKCQFLMDYTPGGERECMV